MTDYTNEKDDGATGKNFEVTVRMAITPKTRATYCKGIRMTDHFIKIDGKRINIEVKTGAGTLDYNRHGLLDTTIPATDHIANLLPGTDFIVYAPEWDGDRDAIADNAWVFTRTDFLDFLANYPGMVRYTKKGNTAINIQTFTNSKRRANYVWQVTLDQPTLGEWLATIR